VGKFRIKRTEALRRLEATSRNLERINDLLGEVTRQRNDLKSQANKARRYQDLRKEANEIARLITACDVKDIAKLKGIYETELGDIQARLSQLEEKKASQLEKMASFETECSRLKAELETLSSQVSSAESKHLIAKREIETSEDRLNDISSTIDMLAQTMEETRRSIADEEARALALKQEQQGLNADIEVVQAHIEQLQENHNSLVKEYDIKYFFVISDRDLYFYTNNKQIYYVADDRTVYLVTDNG